MADWLLTAALVHPDGEALRGRFGLATLPLLPHAQGRLAVRFFDGQQAGEEGAAPLDFTRTAPADPALEAALLASFAREYPGRPLSALPAKLAVSSIAHEGAAPVLARPAFLYREKLTGAERGTAMHAVLQFADFAAMGRDTPAEVRRLSLIHI